MLYTGLLREAGSRLQAEIACLTDPGAGVVFPVVTVPGSSEQKEGRISNNGRKEQS